MRSAPSEQNDYISEGSAQRGCLYKIKYAGVAELADALALGASVTDVQVQVLSPAPYWNASIDTILAFLFFLSKFA